MSHSTGGARLTNDSKGGRFMSRCWPGRPRTKNLAPKSKPSMARNELAVDDAEAASRHVQKLLEEKTGKGYIER